MKLRCKLGIHKWNVIIEEMDAHLIRCKGGYRECKLCGKVIDTRCRVCKEGGDCFENWVKQSQEFNRQKERKKIFLYKEAFKQAIRELEEEQK